MAKQSQSRILRNYRNRAPTAFHSFNQRVSKCLTDNPKIPASIWAGNPALLPTYLSVSVQHSGSFHKAGFGSKLDIADRAALQEQLVDLLDEIASLLESAAIRNPDILLYSGFDLAKERRSRPRTKAALTVSEDLNASSAEQPSSG